MLSRLRLDLQLSVRHPNHLRHLDYLCLHQVCRCLYPLTMPGTLLTSIAMFEETCCDAVFQPTTYLLFYLQIKSYESKIATQFSSLAAASNEVKRVQAAATSDRAAVSLRSILCLWSCFRLCEAISIVMDVQSLAWCARPLSWKGTFVDTC